MAKVVSSKPYATGSGRKPATPKKNSKATATAASPEKASPVRTSPRRRSIVSESAEKEPENLVVQEPKTTKAAQSKKQKKRPVPQPPSFNEGKRAATKSPRKAAKVSKADSEENTFEPPEIHHSIGDMHEHEAGLRRSPRRASIEAQQKLIASKLDLSASPEQSESSSLFHAEEEEEVEESPALQQEEEEDEESPALQQHEERNPFLESESETFTGGPFYNDEVYEAEEEQLEEYENYDAEEEDEDDLGKEYNAQFERHSSAASAIKDRIRQYFARYERPADEASRDNLVWKRVSNWIGERLVPTARELTHAFTQKTIELTKAALEQLNAAQRTETPLEADAITEDDDDVVYEELINDYSQEPIDEDIMYDAHAHEDTNFEMEEEGEQVSPKRMKVDSESVVVEEQPVILPPAVLEEEPVVSQMSQVVEARLTEIVLFFAHCNPTTPKPAIYEHLEEFFRLKGDHPLNPTERHLIHTVLKDYLLIGAISLTPTVPSVPLSREVSDEGRKMADIIATTAALNDSPSKSVRLSASGVRFRAPTFTPEEEAQIDALLEYRKQQQQQQQKLKEPKSLSSTGVRSRLQRKLLDLDRTIEIFESIPTTTDNRDSIQTAISTIISEKVSVSKFSGWLYLTNVLLLDEKRQAKGRRGAS